eukprot:364100-Chlamydomonas_euryale.AAC.12
MAMVRPPTLSVPALAAGETTSRFMETAVRFRMGTAVSPSETETAAAVFCFRQTWLEANTSRCLPSAALPL